MDFKNAKELLELCQKQNLPISEIMLRREMTEGEMPEEEARSRMARALAIMKESAHTPIQTPVRSMGGLIGGEAEKLASHQAASRGICGDVLEKAITYAVAVLETNASMGLIVAAPTAGSAGVVPGMLLALQECHSFSDNDLIKALFNAGAIGYLAMRNATVAGAVGGCQAEVGIAICHGGFRRRRALRRKPEAVPRCSHHRAHEYAGSCLRSGRRPGRVPMPEPQRCRCGKRTHRSGDGSCRSLAAHPV